ncbi:MAG: hypothetical protein LBS68_02715 [Puniceicoccales bacterium]|nr:hypothetical protein [Puniceicoccales bacterium]
MDSHRLLVHNLYVRLFSGWGSGMPRIILESPSAEFNGDDNCLSGADFIHVVGNLFTAIGSRWTFFGEGRSIILEQEVQVFFEANIVRTFSTASNGEPRKGEDFTTITAHALQISDSSQGFLLNFSQEVTILANDFKLTCDALEVEALYVDQAIFLDHGTAGEVLRSLRAEGNVHVEEPVRAIHADVMEFFPEEGVLLLSGNVSIAEDGMTFYGQKIFIRRGDKHVLVDSSAVVRRAIACDYDE